MGRGSMPKQRRAAAEAFSRCHSCCESLGTCNSCIVARPDGKQRYGRMPWDGEILLGGSIPASTRPREAVFRAFGATLGHKYMLRDCAPDGKHRT